MHAIPHDADLRITRIRHRAPNVGGAWVSGRLASCRFEALVFRAHAEDRDYELGDSRISKLWIARDGHTVFHWDRGADVPAADAHVQLLIDFLAEGLADLVYA